MPASGQAPAAEPSAEGTTLSPQSVPDDAPSLVQRMREAQEEEQEQQTSQALADRMLQGWTLLGEACPRYDGHGVAVIHRSMSFWTVTGFPEHRLP